MSSKLEKSILRTIALFICLACLAGCVAGAKKDTTATIDTRSVERWSLLIGGKADKAYDFLSPGYRATKPRKEYAEEMNNRPVHWKEAKFIDKECHEDACNVRVWVSFTVRMRAGAPETKSGDMLQEKWVNVSGAWYYVP